MRLLLHLAGKFRGRWVWGALMLLCTNAATMAMPQLFRFAVDGMAQGWSSIALGEIAVTMALVAAGGAVFRVISRIHLFYAARDVEQLLRSRFYQSLCRLDDPFFASHSTGDLMSRASSDIGQVRLLVGPGALNLVNTVIAYAVAIPLMLVVSWKVTVICLVLYPPSLWLMRRFGTKLYDRNLGQQVALGEVSNVLQESLVGLATVRAYGLEAAQERRVEKAATVYLDASVRLSISRNVMWRFVIALGGVGVLLAVFVGSLDVLAGRLTLGELVAAVEYMALLAWPTFTLGWLWSIWQRGVAAMSRLEEVLSATPRILPGERRVPDGPLEIVARHLTIQRGNRVVLRDLDFSLPPGRTLGVVGPVGGGKSTLLLACLRLVEVPAASLFVGGVDSTELTLSALRSRLAYIPQEPALFSASLTDNVRFGRPTASDAEVEEALRRASFVRDIAELPAGLGTLIGERGVMLSGGQRQRVAIARALLLDAPILLLDDALSSVDATTETRILAELIGARRSGAGKAGSTIIVAHRLSAVAHADEIVVLERGAVRERGSHAELLAQGGWYAREARRQEVAAALLARGGSALPAGVAEAAS